MTLFVSNPIQKQQEIAVEKLPVQFGFTIREVSHAIPALCGDYQIPISWQPLQPGKISCQLVFLWNTRFRFTVYLMGEAMEATKAQTTRKPLTTTSRLNTTRVQPTTTQKPEETTFNLSTCNISAILPNENSSMIVRRTQPVTKTTAPTEQSRLEKSTLINKTKIQKTEKMKKETSSIIGQSRAVASNSSALTNNSLSTTQKRIIQSTARSEIQKILEKQKELEKSLPVNMAQLVHELKNFGIGIHQISLIQGYKDIRVAMLLQWIQAVLERYDNLPAKYKVWNFSSPSLKTEEEIVFNLVSNQYRLPSPLPLEEILPREENRDFLHHYQYSNNGCWSASFSPTKIQKKTVEISKDYDEHQMVCKIGHLFNQLYLHKENVIQTKALVVIQNWMHTIYMQKRLHNLRDASTIIEARTRANIERKKLEFLRQQRKHRILMELTVRLQAMARGYLCRKNTVVQKKEVTTLQALSRAFADQKKVFEFKQSALNIQSIMRSFIERESHLDDIYDVEVTQAVIRGYLSRKQFYLDYAELLDYFNEIEMQNFESYIENALEEDESAIVLQQSMVRGLVERRKVLDSISLISESQALVRGKEERSQFAQDKADIISIQSLARSLFAKRQFAEEQKKIVIMQAISRGFIEKSHQKYQESRVQIMQSLLRRVRTENAMIESTERITSMQSLMRRFTLECDTLMDRYRAYILSAIILGSLDRKNKEESFDRVTTLQALIRGRLQRNNQQRQTESLMVIQRAMRDGFFRKMYNNFVGSVLSLQSNMRRHQVQQEKEASINSITLLQTLIRGFRDRKNHSIETNRAVSLQTTIRSFREREKANLMQQGILSIQASLRAKNDRESILDDYYDIYLSQAIIKGVLARVSFYCETFDVISCQASIRGFLERKRVQQQMCTIVDTQTMIRATQAQNEFIQDREHTIVAQTSIRRFLEEKKRSQEEDRVLVLQALARRHVTARFINHIKSVSHQMHDAATKIQKVFRGFMVRRCNADQVNAIRERITTLSANVDERKKLKYRTQRSLEVLLKSNSVNQVMSACANLATTTTWSDSCCESLVTNNAVPILYSFIKMLNRSKPHTELLIHILDILLNLTRIKYLNCLVHEKNEWFEILFDQLQIYREREEIFMRALSLIKKADTKRLKAVREDLLKRCVSLSKLMQRKYATDKKKQNLNKSNLNSSILNNSSMLNISMNSSSLGRKSSGNISGVGHSVSSVMVTYENLQELIEMLSKLK
ncbi:predicted protein [Naegleria gruberi]|uniref:Predicted protein n=1 Tax=Naegleria gruberi TaxID=5762 RepID=D2VET9_NAEGR|nr:uncharacterized protein NAEGRDRAFT_48956 [Naegleria gruberi]EFC44661.1 predicted protein [Naegleria gruberi]|eukprot:XP_002677405.1 predicted protein [Naegleria gruberi strain NEG-M]